MNDKPFSCTECDFGTDLAVLAHIHCEREGHVVRTPYGSIGRCQDCGRVIASPDQVPPEVCEYCLGDGGVECTHR